MSRLIVTAYLASTLLTAGAATAMPLAPLVPAPADVLDASDAATRRAVLATERAVLATRVDPSAAHRPALRGQHARDPGAGRGRCCFR